MEAGAGYEVASNVSLSFSLAEPTWIRPPDAPDLVVSSAAQTTWRGRYRGTYFRSRERSDRVDRRFGGFANGVLDARLTGGSGATPTDIRVHMRFRIRIAD